jgi:AAA ATPase domain
VGRRREMATLEAVLDRVISGRGGVLNVVASPGIGKSRLAREAAALATDRSANVVWAFCESHAREVPFHAATRLLRASTGVADLEGEAARTRVREQLPDSDPQDLLLLDDLLGIADPGAPLPAIDPDARRRRLTALIKAASLARTRPTLFIIEDAHWIDDVSESLIADLLTVIPQTRSMVLITARPEYRGILTQVPSAQLIALAPLGDSETSALLGQLLGSDPSVDELAAVIAERAAGNPFFAEEMVRELAQRGVLTGARGDYLCHTDVGEVRVPATVQAAIAARIDRLSRPARRTLNAAAVIGVRFGADLLAALDIDVVLDEPLEAELIDQVRIAPNIEYAFRHLLIRAVAYESQLKSDRAELHRRLAAAIESGDPAAADENAALIAEHATAAGDTYPAYAWNMRSGAWSTNRDVGAARLSWERAQTIADRLPIEDPNRSSMRIAPRTMLCATAYQSPALEESRHRFAELRELCSAAGDKVSLAVGMSGLATVLAYTGHSREAAPLVSEQMSLLKSIGDPNSTMGLGFVAFNICCDAGELGEVLQLSQTIIDLAAGDAVRGAGFGFGSPLAIALAWRSNAGWFQGRPGWRQDLHDAVVMARDNDPTSFAVVVAWTYNILMAYGALGADDGAVRLCEEAVQAAGSSADIALRLAEYALAAVLLRRDTAADRRRGLELMVQFREFVRKRAPFLVPVAELWIARDRAGRGNHDDAIAAMRQSRGRAAPGKAVRVRHLGRRRSGRGAAGTRGRRRCDGSRSRDRAVSDPTRR